jgi:transposase
MEVVFPYCAGLDVHKKRVTACRLVSDNTGQGPEGVAELQTFGTMTHELLALADWLVEAGITHVAMESTGEYWKPVYNLLEGIGLLVGTHDFAPVFGIPVAGKMSRVDQIAKHDCELAAFGLRPPDSV